MLPTKLRFIWLSGFKGAYFLEINQSETRIACGGHVYYWIGTKWAIFIKFYLFYFIHFISIQLSRLSSSSTSTGVTSGAETSNPSWVHEFTVGFVLLNLYFLCRSLFFFLLFFFCSFIACLSSISCFWLPLRYHNLFS
jgi:hypothetical protein